MHRRASRVWSAGLLLVAAWAVSATSARAQHYQQTNLVSDESGATTTDPNLVNPWGLARSSGSPWWTANNGSGTSTLFNGSGVPQPGGSPLVVTIPPGPGSSEGGVPTGAVFNGSPDFQLTPGNPARFIFATEDGTISGWNPAVDPTHAVIMFPAKGQPASGAVYKGLALAMNNGQRFLYATNFSKRRIDVFDASFMPVKMHEERFEDDELTHRGFAPFGIQNLGGDLFVTYAKRDPTTNDDVPGAGVGYV
ncbi:MAG TPA: TIGR03118 family protein, partial [Vicinamibacteria bacterium]|nr:TIGR03118 family protein [Vicinamibacteria bacterium]